ncbi:MAG: VWA domain-containing protein, partial [Planctomycetes bacterium]|nr:VWA domain-containing protein [Planctomycetota bacterium]
VPRDEPRMTGVVVPGRLPPGVPVFVGATISGPPGLALLVELRIDGHSTTSRGLVISASGRTSLALSVAPPAPGWHEVVVALRGAPGAPENDVAAAGVLVGGPPRVRIVNAPAFARELRTLGYDVGEGAADEPLGNLDLLVLRNVPVTQFERSGAAVREYVEAGGGLLVLGGPRSFGPGGYSGRPVEDALPVRGDPARDGLLAVVLLDCSGTMRESFSNSPGAKLDAARSAVAKLLSSLPDDADFLFVPFTAGPLADGLPLSLREPGGRERAAALIAAAREARGGTAIAPPLRMAGAVAREVAATRPLRRTLVILVTDGRLEEETADEVLDAALSLRRAGARLEVLSVGADADRGFLSRLADSAGRVVEVESDGGLRDAFLDALLSAEGEGMILSGTLHARRGPGRDPEEPAILPAVSGMVRTWARAAAEVPWVAGDDIPLVAHGRFGLGRSAVVTTDPCGDWAPGWAGSGLLSALADLVRRPAALSGPRAEVRRDGPHLLLTAHVDAPVAELRGSLGFAGGTPVPVVLHAAGPGRYEGRVRTDAWGAARLTLAGGESVFDGGVAVSGPSEYGESGQDPARLSALADAFGEPAVPPRGGFAASPFVALIGLVIFLVDRTLLLKKRPLRRR